jgi:hypothetical protein
VQLNRILFGSKNRKMKKAFLQTILLLLATLTFAQSNIEIGEKAPKITITDWVKNKPDDTNLEGKYIVLGILGDLVRAMHSRSSPYE